MTVAASQRTLESKRSPQADLEQCRALLGRRLADRFEVGNILAYGGSSIIFEGWHLVLRHPVAVKVLRADYALDPELVNHFAQEAMVTAQMRSPHVIRVFDTGLIDDRVPYTVLELLRGQTLNELRRTGCAFTPEEAIDLVLQACRALDESHSRGIIHRDIKPDNLFLAELPDGTHVLKVIDFGVAKHGVAHTFLTEAWVGTPGYMAPEQISNPSGVDHRADIWALGVVLFELLTGRSPFRGTTTEELLTSTMKDEPLPLEVAHQGLPPELYETVRRCLEKEPALRVQRVQELAAKLMRVRERLAWGEELHTGIVRLPDNWDMRVTPPHGWSLPGPTIALKPSVSNAVWRRRLSLGAGLVAGALFGVAIANYRFDAGNSSQTPFTEVASMVQIPAAMAAVEPRMDPLFTTASAEPEAKPIVPQSAPTLELMSLPAQVTPGYKPASAPATSASVVRAPAVAVAPVAATLRPIAPKVTAPKVAPSSNVARDDVYELLTPWTKPKK